MKRSQSLREWLAFARQESATIARAPARLFQCAANEPLASSLQVAADRRWREGHERRPWVRRLDSPAQRPGELVLMAPRAVEIGPCAWSPAGERLVAAEVLRGAASVAQIRRLGGLRLHLWELATGKLEMSWTAHECEIVACDLSPDGEVLASLDREGTLSLWHFRTGERIERRELPRGFPNQGLCSFSADGEHLVASTRTGLVVLARSRLAHVGSLPFTHCAAWSPTGARIAAWVNDGDGVALRLFDPIETGASEPVARLEVPSESGEPTCVEVTNGDEEIITGFSTGVVLAWRPGAVGPARTVARLEGRCFALAQTADGTSLWVGVLHRGVWLVDRVDGSRWLAVSRPASWLAVSRRRRDLAVATSSPAAVLVVRDAATRVPEEGAAGAAPDSMGSALPADEDGGQEGGEGGEPLGRKAMDTAAGLRDLPAHGRPRCSGLSPCDRWMVVGGGGDPRDKFRFLAPTGWVGVWNVQSRERIWSFDDHADVVLHCAFLADGGRVVSVDASGVVRYWDPRDGREVAVFETGHPVSSIEAQGDDVLSVRAPGEQGARRLVLVEPLSATLRSRPASPSPMRAAEPGCGP